MEHVRRPLPGQTLLKKCAARIDAFFRHMGAVGSAARVCSMSKQSIDECVRDSLEAYFQDLRGIEPAGLYELILKAVEKPMLELVMDKLYVGLSRIAADPTDFYHLPRDRVVELGERVAI